MITVKAETNELYIDGIIGFSWAEDGVTARDVGTALEGISGRATVRINSPGGSADEGIAIYNLLKRRGEVDTHNEALAASAASIIFLAGENRTMERGSRLMIHCSHCVAIGNRKDLAMSLEAMRLTDEAMRDIYEEHTGLSSDEVMALMESESWYDANESKKMGLATAVAPTVKRKMAAAAAWFNNPPADLFDENAVQTQERKVASLISAAKIAEIRARM